MTMLRRGSRAVLFGLCALFGVQTYASEILTIPASAAQFNLDEPANNCHIGAQGFFAVTPQPDVCELHFPITIPAGHWIKQIAVVNGTLDPGFPDPFIYAYLYVNQISAPYDEGMRFYWSSHVPVPDGTLATTLLMRQFGKNFPDSFITQNDGIYHVVVYLTNGAFTSGLQITYD